MFANQFVHRFVHIMLNPSVHFRTVGVANHKHSEIHVSFPFIIAKIQISVRHPYSIHFKNLAYIPPFIAYTFFHDGECLTTPAPEPDCGLIDCPQDVSPFCAIPTGFCGQPITFNNKCLLEVYNCFNPNERKVSSLKFTRPSIRTIFLNFF